MIAMIWPEGKFTRFEVARLIGARSLQVALGAPVLIKTGSGNSSEVAKEEFVRKLIPMTVKRRLPNGQHSVVNAKVAIDRWISENAGSI